MIPMGKKALYPSVHNKHRKWIYFKDYRLTERLAVYATVVVKVLQLWRNSMMKAEDVNYKLISVHFIDKYFYSFLFLGASNNLL